MNIQQIRNSHRSILIAISLFSVGIVAGLLWMVYLAFVMITPTEQQDLEEFVAKSACHRELVLEEKYVILNINLKRIERICRSRDMQAKIWSSQP